MRQWAPLIIRTGPSVGGFAGFWSNAVYYTLGLEDFAGFRSYFPKYEGVTVKGRLAQLVRTLVFDAKNKFSEKSQNCTEKFICLKRKTSNKQRFYREEETDKDFLKRKIDKAFWKNI